MSRVDSMRSCEAGSLGRTVASHVRDANSPRPPANGSTRFYSIPRPEETTYRPRTQLSGKRTKSAVDRNQLPCWISVFEHSTSAEQFRAGFISNHPRMIAHVQWAANLLRRDADFARDSSVQFSVRRCSTRGVAGLPRTMEQGAGHFRGDLFGSAVRPSLPD